MFSSLLGAFVEIRRVILKSDIDDKTQVLGAGVIYVNLLCPTFQLHAQTLSLLHL